MACVMDKILKPVSMASVVEAEKYMAYIRTQFQGAIV